MSEIIKRLVLVVFISSFYFSFAQEHNEQKFMTIYIDLKDKTLEEYSIDKDTTSAHFSIYFKEYDSKKRRDTEMNEYNYLIKNPDKIKGDPSRFRHPNFSITFTAFLFDPVIKPKRIKSLQGIKYITIKEFRESNYDTTPIVYIIHKLKDSTYLKWETMHIPQE
jgi:hypothetical protein